VRIERTGRLIAYFRTHPCIDCGEADPIVLEFYHLRDKKFDISNRLVSVRWETILQEIEKCEVVCANCHRRRTLIRRGALRVKLTSR
jgi:ActR/RegA family two-component response regulator